MINAMLRLRVPTFQLILVFFVFGLSFLIASASILIISPELMTKTMDEAMDFGVETDIHSSSKADISFSYPKGWEIQEHIINSIPYIRVEKTEARGFGIHSPRRDHMKVEILVFPNNGLSLDEWVDKQNQRSQPGQIIIERKEIEVSGERGIYQLEEYTNYKHISPAVFVAKEDKVYIINFSNNRVENGKIINGLIASFKFNS